MTFKNRPYLSATLGISPRNLIQKIKSIPWFLKDYNEFKKKLGNESDFPLGRLYPILTDKHVESGVASGHYFHQDLLISQKIFKNNPNRHVDIGSRIDGFIAHVASYREIEVFDIRPLSISIPNVTFVQANLIELSPSMIDYTDSISSLHALEHFGLGRYNDPIDPHGHTKALENIFKILESGGKFYFSTPIGPQRIEFNAHRVFSIKYLLNIFADKYAMNSFSYVDDKGDLYSDVELTDNNIDNNFNCQFGCGIFELTKL